MYAFIARRALALIPVLLGVSLLVFSLAFITPGDPVLIKIGMENASEEEIARIRSELGLDRPFWVQFGDFLAGAVQGDLGMSYRTNRPVIEMIKERLPATLELTLTAFVLSIAIAIPIGVISAVKKYSLIDYTSMMGALFGISMPSFWLGLVLILIASLYLGWFPASGRGGSLLEGLWVLLTQLNPGPVIRSVRHLALPSITLGLITAALITRLTRSNMLEVLKEDYIRTARAKGLSERVVVYRHALKNALLPVVTVLGLRLGQLLGGSVIVETVFAWPGAGRMIISSINRRDFMVVQGMVLVLATAFVLANLAVDIIYTWLDPRIRYD